MDNDKLEHAKNLKERIDKLINHRDRIKAYVSSDNTNDYKISSEYPISLNLRRSGYQDTAILYGKFFNLDEFLSVYIMRVEKELAIVQTEFASL